MDVGQLSASLTLDTGLFMAGIAAATAAARSLSSSMSNALGGNAQNAISNTTKSVNSLGSSFKDLGRIVSGIVISQAFYGMVDDVKKATSSVFEFTSSMEQAKIAMSYFVGKQNAQGFIQSMQDFTTQTPFYTEQVLDLSRRLMAAGVQANQVRPMLSILNDAASANPAPEVQGGVTAQMERLVLAITEVMDRGKMMGKEMNQFANAGIPVFQILHNELGLTAKQMSEVGKTAIPAQTAITAILKGLKDRYSGAAEAMTNTMSGAIRVIKDDLLMMGQTLIQMPFDGMRDKIVAMSKQMNELRKAGQAHGLGGMFEDLVPKDAQPVIRTIIGSFESLGASIGKLVAALKPAATLLMQTLGGALATVLPPVAAIVKGIADLVYWAETSVPAVKIFTAAVMTILVADAAANSLRFLWAVTRMGAICSVVADAVMMLVRAVQALAIASMENPIVGVVMLIAAALMYLAFSSGYATEWLNALTAKLGQLAGFNVADVLKPTNDNNLQQYLNMYNQQLNGINDNLSDTGKNLTGAGDKAKKAGKQVKDTFIAAFDEVFQVPDQLDKVANSLGGVGDAAQNLPNMGMPSLPSLPTPPVPKIPSLPTDFNPPPTGTPPAGGPPNGGGPPVEPPNMAPVTAAVATVNSLIAEIKAKLSELWGDVATGLATAGQKVADWATEGLGEIRGWVTQTVTAIQGWVTVTEALFNGWATVVAASIVSWATTAGNAIITWATTTEASIASWVTQAATAISGWVSGTVILLTGWAVNAAIAISTWATNSLNSIEQWAKNTATAFTNWVTSVQTSITLWVALTIAAIATWASQTQNSFVNWSVRVLGTVTSWATTSEAHFSTWAQNVITNIENWATTLSKDFADWATTTQAALTAWVTATAGAFVAWGTAVGEDMASWANGTIKIVSDWLTNTATGFSSWINGVANGFVSWANSVLQTFGEWANEASGAVSSFGENAWNAFSSFLSGSASSVVSWANSVINSVWGAVLGIMKALAALAAAAGHSIGVAMSDAAPTISDVFSGVGNWVSENKSWLVPAAIGAAAIGAIGATILTGGAAAPAMVPLLGLETGGIVDKEQIIRIGERDRQEAVIPLQNSSYMKPFSAAVANDLAELMSSGPAYKGSGGSPDTRPILYVGNLIADDRSLKELERKLQVIRISENQRMGG